MKPYNIPKEKKHGKNRSVRYENPILKLITSFLVLAIGCVLAGMLALKFYLVSLPPIKNLNSLKPNIVTTFCASGGEVIKTFAAFTYSNVELKEVPKELVQALIATEDKNFYKHKGYDGADSFNDCKCIGRACRSRCKYNYAAAFKNFVLIK